MIITIIIIVINDDNLFINNEISSTTDATFALLSLVQHYLNNNKRLYVAFIDLTKQI